MLVICSGIDVLLGMQSALQVKMLIGANAMMFVVGMGHAVTLRW